MHTLRDLLAYFGNATTSPELVRAQYGVMTRQTPLMYAILVVNILAIAIVNFGKAPFYLTVLIPGAVTIVAVLRSYQMATDDADRHTIADLRKKLNKIVALAVLLGLSIPVWALAMFVQTDLHGKLQVAFFIGITVVVVITCLMPLRQISMVLFAAAVVPTSFFLLLQPETTFRAIGANMLLAIAGMVFVLLRSNSDFHASIRKQVALEKQRHELQKLHDQVTLLANEDSLTGLPNRRSYFARLDVLTTEGSRGGFLVGVIDLDGFKPVNDVHGHGAGDKLLRDAAKRLSDHMPPGGMLARLGGDEFGLILVDPGDDRTVVAQCETLLASLTPAFDLDEGSAMISATCGIARCNDTRTTGDELYEMADFALYHSKENNRGAVTMFSEEHASAIKKVATIAHRLREANIDKDFHLHFQPIVDGRNGNALGFEALARWSDTVLGDVPPDVFIRAAEQNGMIGKITLSLLRQALDAAAQWPQKMYLSFNLSANDLCSPDTMMQMLALIEDSGFPADRLVFEITESAVMQDFDRATVSIEWLRGVGASIALDDFGTGYSSLSYVRRLPIDRVKIDRSFIVDIENDTSARDIVQAIVGLCRALGLGCIVEGVETHAQLAALSAMGCDAYQGYLFGRAVDIDKLHAHFGDVAIAKAG